jgi:hypothetical protein
MKLGILADVHEDVERLSLALGLFRRERVDQVVFLGDLFDTGRRIAEAAAPLAAAVGVWGNHELGLCLQPDARARARYGGPVLDFMATLRPRLEIEGCLFTHGLPHWDAADPAVYYVGDRPETPEGLAGAFAASEHPIRFTGHFHRWLAATPDGLLPWDGGGPLTLQPGKRYLIVVAAVCDGWCAVFDTLSGELTPCRLPGPGRTP